MNKEAHTEQPLSLEEVADIAAQYLEASDEEPEHQDRLEGIEAKLDELESTREEVAEDVGEDHYLVEDIDADIQELKDEHEALQESTEDIAQLRKDILRAAAEEPGFRLNEHWLNSKTLRALTHALYATEEETLIIADQELRTPDDGQGLDRMQKIQIKREIVHLSRDQLASDERVIDCWEDFEDSRAHQAFPVIALDPGVGPSEIAEAQDKTSSTVRNWTSDLSDQENMKMVYTPKQGQYHLSTVGKYYAKHYADLDGANGPKEIEEEVEVAAESSEAADTATEETDEDEDEDSEQVSLGNTTNTTENQSDGSTNAGQREISSEAEATEENAEALFNDVSETRRTNE